MVNLSMLRTPRWSLPLAALLAAAVTGTGAGTPAGSGSNGVSRDDVAAILEATAIRAASMRYPSGALGAKLLLGNAVSAMGGQDFLDEIDAVSFDCMMSGEWGSMGLTVESKANNTVRFTQKFYDPSTKSYDRFMVITFDGKQATADEIATSNRKSTLLKPQVLPQDAVDSLLRAGELWNPLQSATGQFEASEYKGLRVYEGVPCLTIQFSKPRTTGYESATLYLDALTLTPVGQTTSTVRDTIIAGSSRIDTWQVINGFQVPKNITVTSPAGTSTLVISNLRLTMKAGAEKLRGTATDAAKVSKLSTEAAVGTAAEYVSPIGR